MRIRRIPKEEIRPGALMEGDVLIEADMGFDIDNMEGIAVHNGADGEVVITIISDDNFNSFLQRTVLLQFALPRDRHPRAARASPGGAPSVTTKDPATTTAGPARR